MVTWAAWAATLLLLAAAYDPEDPQLPALLPAAGTFEAFYPREAEDGPVGAARAPHSHGSFYSPRRPGLVDVRNAPAFGYLFGGGRRFNYD
ncbi:uncharacterized protein LOC134538323 [Bacillus rossius redtenbacheri]|uniref:uncharacterized protein LOC134538323 n=1 Tax=Bacillus rossius redtenbacheri TaxID=93214 RepID=UPI002FDD735A